MRDEWIEVTIRGVVIDPEGEEPIILLEDEQESSILAIAADPSVAGAIIAELEGIDHEQAQTLLYRFFVRHGVAISRVELSYGQNGDAFATLHYHFQNEHLFFDVRPIDALLVAVQTQAPIYASGDLLDLGCSGCVPEALDGRDVLILSRQSRQ